MTDLPLDARPAETYAEVEDALLSRWPETKLEPSLDRIRAFTELLGEPQRSFRSVHLTGTNGKTSTSRMIETLLRALDLRAGRFTSPHLERMSERISVDGEPLDDEAFVRAFNDVTPYTHLVDASQPHPLSFFETIVAMAYAAFADAPVDVAIVEVGLGGAWDATNVADADVAVVTPIDLDHTHLLGSTITEIAREKAGIIKPGAHAILAGQSLEAAEVLMQRCVEMGALPQREGIDFGVIDRRLAVGGQLIRLNGAEGPVDDIFLPLHGAHQAANAAQALAAVEAFLGLKALNPDVAREGFAAVSFPGRLEVVRRSPTVVLDAAHNPHGARAAAAAITEAFSFNPLVGVVAVMADKDARGLLTELEEGLNQVVVTQVASTSRGLPAPELGELAAEVFGAERVQVAPRLDDAIELAVNLAEGHAAGIAGVLVTGSVVAVGEARTLLVTPVQAPVRSDSEDTDDDWDADYGEDGANGEPDRDL